MISFLWNFTSVWCSIVCVTFLSTLRSKPSWKLLVHHWLFVEIFGKLYNWEWQELQLVGAQILIILSVFERNSKQRMFRPLLALCWKVVQQGGHLLLRANVERQLTNNSLTFAISELCAIWVALERNVLVIDADCTISIT